MFSQKAAAEALQEHGNRIRQVASLSKEAPQKEVKSARDMAQAARDAARTLQRLDTEVPHLSRSLVSRVSVGLCDTSQWLSGERRAGRDTSALGAKRSRPHSALCRLNRGENPAGCVTSRWFHPHSQVVGSEAADSAVLGVNVNGTLAGEGAAAARHRGCPGGP